MTNIPVVAFAAYSGTGKTTLIEKLISELKSRGLRLAVIKHDGHRFEIDHEGKDSWRFAQAGADITMISSAEKTAYIEKGDLSLEQLLDMVHGVDLILVEGYKNKNLPQIGIARKETGKGFTADLSRFIALVTDIEVTTDLPCFGLEDISPIADFIQERMAVKNTNDFTHFNDRDRAGMVDAGEKPESHRTAAAAARVLVSKETFALIRSGDMKKDDLMTVCQTVIRDGVDLSLHLDESRCSVEIEAAVSCDRRTGVEMEALSAVSTAALTVYDMCKAVQKDMVISDIRLLKKPGGIPGDFAREEN